MEYMGTKEAAEKWGYTQSTISKWCREGKIYLVVKPEKIGGQWQIPVNPGFSDLRDEVPINA